MTETDRASTRDTYLIENADQHTQKCLEYAERTGKPFCIVECGSVRRRDAGQAVEASPVMFGEPMSRTMKVAAAVIAAGLTFVVGWEIVAQWVHSPVGGLDGQALTNSRLMSVTFAPVVMYAVTGVCWEMSRD